ncbi:MAG: T9SS-dependent M36 family metallopeptidase [Bacteroidota bacterium]
MNLNSTCWGLVPLLFLSLFSLSLSAQERAPLDVALDYLMDHRDDWDLSEADLKQYRVRDTYTSKHNGVTHIYLNQQFNGVDVRNAITSVHVMPDNRVLGANNRFLSDLDKRIQTARARIDVNDAVLKVKSFFKIEGEDRLHLKKKINNQSYVFDAAGLALEPITAKLVYEPLADKSVRLAWEVEWYELGAQNWWNAKIDAQTGVVLAKHDQIIHCEFNHAEDLCKASGHTHDHNHGHHHNHGHVAKKEREESPFSPANLLMANSYNVFAVPLESPNHGGRSIEVDPSNAIASPFGWHDTDGEDGPEFTITRGNNVHAYHDIFNRNGSSDDEPDGGDQLEFDYPLDLSTDRPYTQVDPAVVNLFYWNNLIHDVWYQYGFDEPSGNFQVNNYDRGGEEGDYVRAEALDGGGTNNANFGTGGDGSFARMQMFIWTRDGLPNFPDPTLEVLDSSGAVTTEYRMVAAQFGDELPEDPIVGKFVIADDATDTATDACDPLVNGGEMAGNIALIDRGNCQFGTKMLRAQNNGAVAVIICNNNNDPIFPMGPGDDGAQVTIPSVMISIDDCAELRVQTDATVSLGASVLTIPQPGPSGIDGDFDNGIIVHEYGHGISIRLTGGPSTGGCLGSREQAGEGWSDWFALAMQTTADDTPDEPRGIGTYAVRQPVDGDGIRTHPYSRNMSVNPHTYADIASESVPHGVGSIFCVTLWDLYWNFVDIYGFDENLYTGEGGNNKVMQLVIDGLKMQACDPNFLDSRDAILMADEANYEGIHRCLIWETFARRGIGFSAQEGGNEAFDLPPNCDQSLKIAKTADTEVDAGEDLVYTIEVRNDTEDTLLNVVVDDKLPEGTTYIDGSSSCTGSTADNDNNLTIPLGTLLPGESEVCEYRVMVASTPFSFITFSNGAESNLSDFDRESGVGTEEWGRSTQNSFEDRFSWFARDIETESDQYLTLAEPIRLDFVRPVLSFRHDYDTEASWDGGVVEISIDGGQNWDDLGGDMILNGYNSRLQDNPASALSGREAFNGRSNGYIQTLIDLTNYSGQDAIFRFRFATDGATGGVGWFVDNVELFGELVTITNEACVSADNGEESCTSISTTVFEGLPTSTNDLANQLQVTLAPNPTSGRVFIMMSSPVDQPTNIRLSGIDGRLIKEQQWQQSNGTFELDLSDLSQGVYFVQLQTDTAKVVHKLVVQ